MTEEHIDNELRDLMERAASRVLADHMDLELDEQGKVDFSKVSQEDMQKHAKPLALGMMGAFLGELKEGRYWKRTAHPAEGAEEADAGEEGEAETANAGGSERVEDAIRNWGDALVAKVSGQLHDRLGLPLTQSGVLDVDALQDEQARKDVALAIQTAFTSLSDTIQSVTSKVTELRPRQPSPPAPEAAADAKAAAGTDADAEWVEGADHLDDDNVIDLSDWKRQDAARKAARAFFGAGDVLTIDQEFLREHGPKILSDVLEKVAKNLVPPKIELNLPLSEAEKRSAPSKPTGQAAEEKESGGLKVSLKLDLNSLFGRFAKTQPQDTPDDPDETQQ